MDMKFGPELAPFREEVRRFFAETYPQDILEKTRSGASLTTAEVRRGEQALGARGWLASAWPTEHGGPGWSIEEQYIFDEELERAGAPTVTPMGVVYVGPVLYTFGTEAQQDRWLPGIRDGSEGWAQGYSEPGSGSDLASLQFKAEELDGGGWRLDGTKIWTSAAQHADWIFILARTSHGARKQEGISFLIAPMDDPGISVRPLITLDGKHVLNEVRFDGVEVPADHLVGEEGEGWRYSTYLLGHERTSYARIGGKRAMLRALKSLARKTDADGRPLIADEGYAARLAEAEIALDALEVTVLRILSGLSGGEGPGNAASIVKIAATETHQQITELMLEAAGSFAAPGHPDSVAPPWAVQSGHPAEAAPMVAGYFAGRAQSIYGGTNEIQRNIIAKRVLGL